MTPADFTTRFKAEFVRAKDGDTIVVELRHQVDIRLEGYDAPELIGPFRKEALEAQADLAEWCAGKTLYVELVPGDKKSWSRPRAFVRVETVPGAPLVSVNEAMKVHDKSNIST